MEFYVDVAREARGNVLELACGTGRVTIPIAHALASQTGRAVAPGRADYMSVPIHLRSLFPLELPLPLATNGFRIETRYGDFGREPFGSESPRQVCLCRVDDMRATGR